MALRNIRGGGLAVALVCAASSSLSGDTFEWTNAVSGNFNDPTKWNNITGIDPAPPTAGDNIEFNEPGIYSVTLTQDESADALRGFGGDVLLLSNLSSQRTLKLATGAADANISGGFVTIGSSTNPVFLNLPNTVSGGGFSISVMNIGSGSDGIVTVDGPNSRLDVMGNTTHSFGLSGAFGGLTLLNGSIANIGTQGGTLNLGVSGVATSQGDASVVQGSTLNTGHINVATNTSGAIGGINVIGAGSTLTQSLSNANLTVGSSSGGAGVINIQDNSLFETGTGTTTINANGTVIAGIAGSGTLRVRGPMVVNSGTLNLGSNTALDLTTGVTLTARNGAQLGFLNYDLDSNTHMVLESGADLVVGQLDIGGAINSSIIVDGAGTTLTALDVSEWGSSDTATVTFRQGAGGDLANVILGSGFFFSSGGSATLNVETGALVTTDSLTLAEERSDNNAVINLSGSGSNLTQNGASTLTVGPGTAEINVTGGKFNTGTGAMTVRGTLNINTNSFGRQFDANGPVIIDGGDMSINTNVALNTDNVNVFTAVNLFEKVTLISGRFHAQDVSYFSGNDPFDFISGTLELDSDQTFRASLIDALDVAVLSFGKSLKINATSTLQAPIILDGGVFSTGSLVNVDMLDFKRGRLIMTSDNLNVGTGGLFGTSLTLLSDKHIEVTNAVNIATDGLLTIAGGSLTGGSINNSGWINGSGSIFGTLTNQAGGEIQAQPGQNLTLWGTGNINLGQITLAGGQLHFTQGMTNDATGLILGNGTLRVDSGTTNDGTMAFSATANVIGDVTNNAIGLITSSGGTTTFFDDVVNNGEIRTNLNSFTVYFGSYSGNGDTGAGTVIMEGDLKPGSSPGLMNFAGDLAFGNNAALEIEIGGLSAGTEFDQLSIADNVSLNGTLDLSLINGFSPSLGHTFPIITANNITGTFADILGLDLGGGLLFDVVYSPSDVTLQVISTVLAGDLNADGFVGIEDLNIVLGKWNQNVTPGELLSGDPSNDGFVGIEDLNVVLGNWNAGTPPAPTVPEPTSLFAFCLVCLQLLRKHTDA